MSVGLVLKEGVRGFSFIAHRSANFSETYVDSYHDSSNEI